MQHPPHRAEPLVNFVIPSLWHHIQPQRAQVEAGGESPGAVSQCSAVACGAVLHVTQQLTINGGQPTLVKCATWHQSRWWPIGIQSGCPGS